MLLFVRTGWPMALTQKGQTRLVKQAAEPLVLLHASSPPWHAVTQPLINLYQHKDIQATKNWTYCGYSLSQNYFFSLFPTELFWHIYLVEGCFDFHPCWPLTRWMLIGCLLLSLCHLLTITTPKHTLQNFYACFMVTFMCWGE